MKVTKEEINGKWYTVVKHSTGEKDAVLLHKGGIYHYYENYYHKDGTKSLRHIATALPPLPRYPKPEDAQLLTRYMAEGLTPIMENMEGLVISIFSNLSSYNGVLEDEQENIFDTVSCCINEQGEKVEVAINDQ